MTALGRIARLLRVPPAPTPGATPGGMAPGPMADGGGQGTPHRLGRSLALWHLGTGGCGACELELAALGGTPYELERLGLRFAASPRHADVLLVTGPVTRTMRAAALRTWEAMADPKWVVAVGGCPIDGGPFRGSYAVLNGLDGTLPVHVAIPGCPPDPAAVLAGLRALLDANARPGSP